MTLPNFNLKHMTFPVEDVPRLTEVLDAYRARHGEEAANYVGALVLHFEMVCQTINLLNHINLPPVASALHNSLAGVLDASKVDLSAIDSLMLAYRADQSDIIAKAIKEGKLK